MTFEVSCPAAESAWALAGLRQAVFCQRLDAKQLESEKRIINEEILQLRDNPDFLGRLLVMEQLFAGHPYGRSPFGDGSAIAQGHGRGPAGFRPRSSFPAAAPCRSSAISSWPRWKNRCAESWGALAKGDPAAGSFPLPTAWKKAAAADGAGYRVKATCSSAGGLPDFNHEHRVWRLAC